MHVLCPHVGLWNNLLQSLLRLVFGSAQGASSESDDLGNSPVAMKASTAPGTDGDVQPHADNKKQGKKVTRRLLRPKGPIMQRKKRVCRGLVYESDHEENTAIQKRSTASKKRRNHACALPKTHLTAVPYKQPMDEGERPLDAEPVARESLLPPNVMVVPSQLHDTLTEPYDVRGSVDLFTSDEEVPPVITEQASPTVNMDELFGFWLLSVFLKGYWLTGIVPFRWFSWLAHFTRQLWLNSFYNFGSCLFAYCIVWSVSGICILLVLYQQECM